jgi:hypothetical protein
MTLLAPWKVWASTVNDNYDLVKCVKSFELHSIMKSDIISSMERVSLILIASSHRE